MTTQDKINCPNIDRVWKERMELEPFRNVERAACHQIAMENGSVMPVLFSMKRPFCIGTTTEEDTAI